ncbi:MAG TPA: integration host factor subunit alpha [Desulfobacteraceae bacterium]|nr:integration host factor subunit alpha [Desulfobacteraceae bacterium]
MTLKKSDIVDRVRDNVRIYMRSESGQKFLFHEMKYEPLDLDRAARIVESLLELIKSALARGEEVRITGFGKFYVRYKWARKGRNPATGETMMLKPRRVVLFKPSPRLKQRINA